MAEDGTTQNCTGDDTCLRHFEYKISIGRCHKCVLLANAPEIEHARIIGLPQCLGCGAASSRLDSDRCGQCVNKDMRNSGSPALSGPSDVRVLPQGQSAGQITSSTLRNLGQYNRNNWKDAANINESGIRAQQSTVPITGINMAALRSNNLPSTECYIFILEPFINSKGCTFLSTFEVIREASLKFSDVVANGITSFNLSWEQESEASLVRSDIHFSRMNNVHIEIGPQAIFRDVLQTILKDSGQSLDKTAPTKFRNRKLPIVYIEAHINLEKFLERTGVSPPRAVFKQKKRPWDGNTSITANVSLLKRSRLGLSNATANFL
ncbi:hypothetical protein K438DRAFT_1670261 [Mycena galopus ATCC 62051]|nr:hypothetical protein K438DRAFT_1670261 [Mycena galopus ATCC 62051]